jgi:hypothetical protein
MWCPGDVEGCAAEECPCPCGVLVCGVHGHADVGEDPYCLHWLRAGILDETEGRGYEAIETVHASLAPGRRAGSRVKTAAARRRGDLRCTFCIARKFLALRLHDLALSYGGHDGHACNLGRI